VRKSRLSRAPRRTLWEPLSDPILDPLLLRKYGSAGNPKRDLWICSQALWPLDHRGGHRSRSYFTTDNQSVSMSRYRAPLWDLRPDIISCWNVAVWNLLSCIYGAPSLTRGRVRNLQCNHLMVRVAQKPKPYFTVSSETPPTWRARFPYL
jgi:hypothetical protein